MPAAYERTARTGKTFVRSPSRLIQSEEKQCAYKTGCRRFGMVQVAGQGLPDENQRRFACLCVRVSFLLLKEQRHCDIHKNKFLLKKCMQGIPAARADANCGNQFLLKEKYFCGKDCSTREAVHRRSEATRRMERYNLRLLRSA